MSFEKEFNQERLAVKKALEETYDVVSIELFSGVITSSAVGNPSLWKNPNANPDYPGGGRFRSNWFLSFGQSSSEISDDITSESSKLNQISSGILRDLSGKSRYLSNNLPYSERLEYEAWSKQQPLGVIAPNVSRVEAMIPRIYKVASAKYGV